MTSLAGVYLFLLGLASGIAALALTAYRRVSPPWLKWLLIACGLLVIGRYVTMALLTSPDALERFWALRHLWFASTVGLTLPSVFAVDQLLRHPAMTPKKLLRWFAPFLIAYGLLIMFGVATPVSDAVAGWAPRLSSGWRIFAASVQAVFVLGFISVCVALMRKVPLLPIRVALLGLAVGHLYLGLDGALLALGRWYFRPFLYSEMLTLLALWHAYETSAALQRGS